MHLSNLKVDSGLYYFVLSIAALSVVSKLKSSSTIVEDPLLTKSSTISAPGKVLIAGGYLVLEHPNLAVAVASSSRFYSNVVLRPFSGTKQPQHDGLTIVVSSPQFGSEFSYVYDFNQMKLVSLDGKNAFVEKCLTLTMIFAQQKLAMESRPFDSKFCTTHFLHITLQANNDFYSQIGELRRRGLPLLSRSLSQLPKFLPCPRDAEGKEQKTGLGSSAALTTSLIASILQWFDVIRIGLRPDSDDRRLVHNLAQLAHGIAQGNIGSGFDVAAAVYG